MIQQPIRNLLQIEILSRKIFPITKSLSSLSNTSDHTGTYYIRRCSSTTFADHPNHLHQNGTNEFPQLNKTKNELEFARTDIDNNGFINDNDDSYHQQKSTIILDISSQALKQQKLDSKNPLDLNHNNSMVNDESSKF